MKSSNLKKNVERGSRWQRSKFTFSHKHIKKKTHPHVAQFTQNIYQTLAEELKTSKKGKKPLAYLGRTKEKRERRRNQDGTSIQKRKL